VSEFLMKGELVGIRPIVPDDFRLIYETWHDPDVQRNLNFVDNDPYGVWLEQARKWRGWLDCIAVSLADGSPAGYVSLGSIKADPELVILLLPAYRGRGLGTEAARLIMDYGFAKLGISRVGGGAYDFNHASQHMLDKLGFVRDPDQDESDDNAWGEGKVAELCYHLDRETWRRTRRWRGKVRPAVFDARPALETIRRLDFIRVCGTDGEARAMDVIVDGLNAVGVQWRYHEFEDWWIEPVDPHLELRGRKLSVRPVMEMSFQSGFDFMSSDGLTVDVSGILAPIGECAGAIAVAERFDRESPVDRDAAAQLMAFEFDPRAEAYLWAQDWGVERVPAAYLRADDVAIVRGAFGEEAKLTRQCEARRDRGHGRSHRLVPGDRGIIRRRGGLRDTARGGKAVCQAPAGTNDPARVVHWRRDRSSGQPRVYPRLHRGSQLSQTDGERGLRLRDAHRQVHDVRVG
jgi:RimJ/RimL family protein N-acetyltransferase